MELKESLVIVHASDSWMNGNLESNNSFKLKSLIRWRINKYLEIGKDVFYTPYLTNEESIPQYFPSRELIKIIDFEKWVKIPTNMIVKFQSMILKQILIDSNIPSIEIWWVMYSACVKHTYKTILTMNTNDLQDFVTIRPKNINISESTMDKSVDAKINYDITDWIFWKKINL